MRKPSCLISWTQPGPDGGRSAGDGRQGGTATPVCVAFRDFSSFQVVPIWRGFSAHRNQDFFKIPCSRVGIPGPLLVAIAKLVGLLRDPTATAASRVLAA